MRVRERARAQPVVGRGSYRRVQRYQWARPAAPWVEFSQGRGTVKVSLPYGVLVGTTAAAARKAIPAAKGKWNPTFQTYELTTSKAPGMYWFSDRKDGSGPVTAISLNPVFCD